MGPNSTPSPLDQQPASGRHGYEKFTTSARTPACTIVQGNQCGQTRIAVSLKISAALSNSRNYTQHILRFAALSWGEPSERHAAHLRIPIAW